MTDEEKKLWAALGKAIQRSRKSRNQIAEDAGISPQTLARYLKGAENAVTLRTIFNIIRALGWENPYDFFVKYGLVSTLRFDWETGAVKRYLVSRKTTA